MKTSFAELFRNYRDKDWSQDNLTVAEGRFLSQRLLESGLDLLAVVCGPDEESEWTKRVGGRCPVEVMPRSELQKLTGFPFHRGVISFAIRPQSLSLKAWIEKNPAARRLIVAPDLTDPENLGALFRSSAGLGWDAVVLGPRSCDAWSRRCAKVSMGAVYKSWPVLLPSPHETEPLLASWTNVAASLEPNAEDLESWLNGQEGKTALLGNLSLWIGNEAHGIDPVWRSICSRALFVPMQPGHDSLNAAVAAGIFAYRLAPRIQLRRSENPHP